MALTNEDLQAIALLLKPIGDSIKSLEQKVDSLEQKVDSLEERMTKVENRLTKVEVEMENGFRKSWRQSTKLLILLTRRIKSTIPLQIK